MSYIEREALREEIESLSVTFCGKELFGELAKHSVVQKINEAPTADVDPVRHGKSISKMHYSDEFICSECGLIMRECCRYEIDEDADGDESCYGFEFKYCPRCGAKMDIESSEKEIN